MNNLQLLVQDEIKAIMKQDNDTKTIKKLEQELRAIENDCNWYGLAITFEHYDNNYQVEIVYQDEEEQEEYTIEEFEISEDEEVYYILTTIQDKINLALDRHFINNKFILKNN